MADLQESKARLGPTDQVRVCPEHGLRTITDLIRDPQHVDAGGQRPRHEGVPPRVEGQRAYAVSLGPRAQTLPSGREGVVVPGAAPTVQEDQFVALIAEAALLWSAPLDLPELGGELVGDLGVPDLVGLGALLDLVPPRRAPGDALANEVDGRPAESEQLALACSCLASGEDDPIKRRVCLGEIEQAASFAASPSLSEPFASTARGCGLEPHVDNALDWLALKHFLLNGPAERTAERRQRAFNRMLAESRVRTAARERLDRLAGESPRVVRAEERQQVQPEMRLYRNLRAGREPGPRRRPPGSQDELAAARTAGFESLPGSDSFIAELVDRGRSLLAARSILRRWAENPRPPATPVLRVPVDQIPLPTSSDPDDSGDHPRRLP